MGEVEQSMRVCASSCCFLEIIRLLLFPGGGADDVGLWQVKVEVESLGDDEEERKACCSSKGVALDDGDGGEGSTQGRAEGKGDTEASANESHGGTTLLVVADVGSNRHGQLDVTLAQSTNDAAGEESAEVGRSDPESDTQDVSDHAPQQSSTTAIAIRQAADDGRCNGLAEGKERTQCSA